MLPFVLSHGTAQPAVPKIMHHGPGVELQAHSLAMDGCMGQCEVHDRALLLDGDSIRRLRAPQTVFLQARHADLREHA
jgi:hypothetical protein